jgi:NADPH-dependent 2,4-dienoyl-CoA reductase/sulfur reductase-like enzyme/nitrite reductase/ring-hydroxylating ferredoxin subunit
MGDAEAPTGPELKAGIAIAEIPDGGTLVGQLDGEAVLLVRRGDEVLAVGATCSHYGGPLGEGLIVGDQVRCPWHHACFDLRSGEAIAAPALNPIPCYRVERQGDLVTLAGRTSPPPPRPVRPSRDVVIVGAGAAGHAAAEMLRREGHRGRVVLIGGEPPVDRPNLSKDYLAGTAPEDWIPLRPPAFYAEHEIELVLDTRVTGVDAAGHQVTLADGRTLRWDALVLATGANPIRLPIPGADLPHVHTLRTLADSRAIIAHAAGATHAVVIGASFIGLEAAASLRARGVAVDVVAPEAVPLERVMGAELGALVRTLHEDHGVRFHLGRTTTAIDATGVTLDDGTRLEAALVVLGVGVRPALELAEQAGCRIDRGVVVDDHLRTSVADVHAIGDIARYPDPRSGTAIRVEHWVVAQRQGQTVARNLAGGDHAFDAVPFFWSQHYDLPINYVGHVEGWDAITVHGSIAARSAVVAYRVGGRVRAVASVHRDRESLEIEAALAGDDQAAIERVLAGI